MSKKDIFCAQCLQNSLIQLFSFFSIYLFIIKKHLLFINLFYFLVPHVINPFGLMLQIIDFILYLLHFDTDTPGQRSIKILFPDSLDSLLIISHLITAVKQR